MCQISNRADRVVLKQVIPSGHGQIQRSQTISRVSRSAARPSQEGAPWSRGACHKSAPGRYLSARPLDSRLAWCSVAADRGSLHGLCRNRARGIIDRICRYVAPWRIARTTCRRPLRSATVPGRRMYRFAPGRTMNWHGLVGADKRTCPDLPRSAVEGRLSAETPGSWERSYPSARAIGSLCGAACETHPAGQKRLTDWFDGADLVSMLSTSADRCHARLAFLNTG